MQIRQLRHFLAAVETGSITQAARDQNVTQPTLSRSIRMLELGLKVDLLERAGSGVSPTRYGALLVEHARSIVTGVDHARDDVAGLRVGRLGHVRLGLGESALLPGVARAIGAVAQAHADLQLSIDYDIQENQLARLRRNEIDAIIDLRRRDLDVTDLDFEAVAQVRFAVLVRPEHPLAGRQMVTRAELARAPWAVLDQPGVDRFYRMLLGPAAEVPVEQGGMIRLRCSAPGMMRMLAQENDILIMQARLSGALPQEVAPLVEVPTDIPPALYDLCIITRRRAYMTGALRVAMQHIRRGLNHHVGAPSSTASAGASIMTQVSGHAVPV